MILDIWNWVRQTALVRYPLKAVTSAKRLPLIQPAPIVVSLEELAPVWLRHNHDFRPAPGEVGRTMTAPAMTMTEALAPATPAAAPIVPSPAVVRAGEQSTPVMPSTATTKRVRSSALPKSPAVSNRRSRT